MRPGDREHPFRLGDRRAVDQHPLGLAFRNRVELRVRRAHPDAAVERNVGVVGGVELDHCNRMRWRAWPVVLSVPSTGAMARISGASQARRQVIIAPFDMPVAKTALRVDVRLTLDPVDHLADEANVVDIVLLRRAAAAAGVPGREDAARETAVAVGEDGDEAGLFRLARSACTWNHRPGSRRCRRRREARAASASAGRHDRTLRHMDKIFAVDAVVIEAEAIVAGRGYRRRVRIGRQGAVRARGDSSSICCNSPSRCAAAVPPIVRADGGKHPDADWKTRFHDQPLMQRAWAAILVTAVERTLRPPLAGRSE